MAYCDFSKEETPTWTEDPELIFCQLSVKGKNIEIVVDKIVLSSIVFSQFVVKIPFCNYLALL